MSNFVAKVKILKTVFMQHLQSAKQVNNNSNTSEPVGKNMSFDPCQYKDGLMSLTLLPTLKLCSI